MTTTTRTKRITTTAPEFPTAEQINETVTEHHIEERRDREASAALNTLVRRIIAENEADHDHTPAEAFREARITGDWEAYRAALEAHAQAQERERRRNVMLSNIDSQRSTVSGMFSRKKEHRAEAGHKTLAYLAEALPDILAAAQALDLTGVPGRPEAVMEAGPEAVEKFTAARKVVDAYAALRLAQGQAVKDIAQNESTLREHPDVTTTGQFRDALHLDATWLNTRRSRLDMLRKDTERRRIRQTVPGARAFFDDAPDALFGRIGDDGFPVDVKGVTARAKWLAKWSARLDFFLPTYDELRSLVDAYDRAVYLDAWRSRAGLVMEVGADNRATAGNEAALALVNLDYRRPDWDTSNAAEDEGVRDAAEANAAAAHPGQHPGVRA